MNTRSTIMEIIEAAMIFSLLHVHVTAKLLSKREKEANVPVAMVTTMVAMETNSVTRVVTSGGCYATGIYSSHINRS